MRHPAGRIAALSRRAGHSAAGVTHTLTTLAHLPSPAFDVQAWVVHTLSFHTELAFITAQIGAGDVYAISVSAELAQWTTDPGTAPDAISVSTETVLGTLHVSAGVFHTGPITAQLSRRTPRVLTAVLDTLA